MEKGGGMGLAKESNIVRVIRFHLDNWE